MHFHSRTGSVNLSRLAPPPLLGLQRPLQEVGENWPRGARTKSDSVEPETGLRAFTTTLGKSLGNRNKLVISLNKGEPETVCRESDRLRPSYFPQAVVEMKREREILSQSWGQKTVAASAAQAEPRGQQLTRFL